MNKTTYGDAIDLIIEDLYKKDYKIKVEAKQLNCEQELDQIKLQVIKQLTEMKSNLL